MGKLSFAGVVVLATVGLGRAQIKLNDETTVVFATVEEGSNVLTARDDFVRSLSPFDRAARMKTDRDVSEEAYLKFVGENVLAWTDAEKERVKSLVDELRPRMAALSLSFPPTVYLIKTSGKEEGGAAYTRGSAIVVPANMLGANRMLSSSLICHELFHVLSRRNSALRERLYEAIGFKRCNKIELPATLKPRKLTNPDAPTNCHYIEVKVDEKPALAVPILFSQTQTYDVNRGGEFFQYLVFQFLLVEREAGSPDLKPVYEGTEPRLVGVTQLAGFWEQVGRNTQYIYHPEEILADNFAFFVMPQRSVPSPEIIEKMRQVLSTTPSAEIDAAGS